MLSGLVWKCAGDLGAVVDKKNEPKPVIGYKNTRQAWPDAAPCDFRFLIGA
jgi:hypothetical protein